MFRSHRLIAGFALACSSFAFANQGVVQIIEPGGHSFTVNAMNNHGVVVGHIFDQVAPNHADRGHGFLWDGTMHILPDLGAGAEPTGINDNGDIIGVSYTYDPSTTIVTSHLVSFTLTTVTDLGSTGVSTRNLTNAGDFAYMAPDAQSHLHAYIRNFYSGATHEVATTLTNPNVTEINSAGHMIGTSQTNLGWFDMGGGVVSMFAVFPANPPAPYNSGRLNAIGEQDQLTGSGGNSERSTSFTYYFAWDSINGFSQIGTQVQINDYNAAGDGVGKMPIPNGGGNFQGIYYHNGVVSPFLDQMGPGPVSPTEVTNINDAGQAIISNPFGVGTWYFFDPALVTNFNPTMVLTGTGTFAYNGNPRVALATAHAGSSSALTPACIITYNPGDSTPPVLPGVYQVTAFYPGDDSKHLNPATATGTITITKLNSSTTATGGTFAYDGGPHPATYVVKTNLGVAIPGAVANITYTPGGTSIPVTPGTYSTLVAFPGDAIYNPSSTSTVVKINNPTPTVTVTGGTFTYNGASHPATATVKDSLTNLVISNPLPTFTYNPGGTSAPVNAGTYQVTTNYSGNASYPAASGTGTIVIQQAATTVSVVGGTFTYNGSPHPATATVHDDSNNLDLSASPTITYSPGGSTAPVDAGTYQATATYAGDTNHATSTGTGTIVIQKATTTTTVEGRSTFVYDGQPHPAVAIVDDVSNSQELSVEPTYSYAPGGSDPPVNAGAYVVTATYEGDANHSPSAGSRSLTIFGAFSSVTVVGGSFTFDGNPHAASAVVNDDSNNVIPGAVATITYSPGGTNAPVSPGTYLATATFAGDGGHTGSSGSATIVVLPSNHAPNAVVGPSVSTQVPHDGNPSTNTRSVTLDGSGSNDPDAGQTLTYEWKDGNGNIVGTAPQVTVTLTPGTYLYTLTVTDPYHETSSSSMSVIVGNEPNVAPLVSAGSDMVGMANASGQATFTVNALATDQDNDPVTLNWYENGVQIGTGSTLNGTFSAGQHTVTVTATDVYGASSSDTMVLSVQYSGSFFNQPINNDGSSIFKQGSTVPVKFTLTGASANANIIAYIFIAKITNNIVGTEIEAVSTSQADSGNLFRSGGSGQWMFNLNTKTLTAGTYQIRADLGDGALHTVIVSLKP